MIKIASGRNQIMLKSYKVTSIRKKSGMVIFGSPQTVVDEGDIYRIAELHVISKGMIEKCEECYRARKIRI